jgi:formamidopyrimidine-DNA glycosylase
MPEMPQMQALSERLGTCFTGAVVDRLEVLGFSALKTVKPSPADVAGAVVTGTGRRAKYLVVELAMAGSADGALRLLVHLGNAGRLDIEEPAKSTRPRGSLARLTFADGRALLVREHGTQHKAGLWILGPGDDGPLAGLGPEVDEEGFAEQLLRGDSTRQLHTLLRDQRFLAGVGRGYADDALNLAGLSPFTSLRSLDSPARQRLVDAVRATVAGALDSERGRSGGLSANSLGDSFSVHNRAGQPCPRCGGTLQRVSFESHEVVYCPGCQTKGKVLADRRLSRLLR